MTRACILIKTVPTRVANILEVVKEIPDAGKVFIAFGRWDIVAWLNVDDFKKLKHITSQINTIDGVRSTETLAEA